ncbi:MAG: hypothetical protein QOF80_1000 [Verrucomicrobiota bacterium]|jgi:hypothetical protein
MTSSPSTNAISGIKRDDTPSGDEPGETGQAGVDLTHLLGTWVNTYRETRSLCRFILAPSVSGYSIETVAATESGAQTLGQTEVRPFAPNVNSWKADGFTARYDFEFFEMSLAAYCAKGLIVVSQYTRFKDCSGRPDYFNREFFFKEES